MANQRITKIVGWKNEAEEDGMWKAPIPKWVARVRMNTKTLLLETNFGTISELHFAQTLRQTQRGTLENSPRGDFYDNTNFHRIVPLSSKGHPFVIQGGDPTGTGMGGPGILASYRTQFVATHDFGVISMARAGDPDSAGCQFFLCLSQEQALRV